MSLWQILKLLASIHIFISLLAGYWDIRLSNAWIYYGQMARIHLYRTLQAHAILGLVIAFLFSIGIVLYFRKTSRTPDRSRIIAQQVAFAVSLQLFLIFFLKAHLVWLRSHIFDLEGLISTAVIAGCSILVFLIVRFIALKFTQKETSKQIAAVIFIICVLGTVADAYISRKLKLPEIRSAANPNIILIVVDTLRWDYLSAYGFKRPITPNLDALAREGVLYENAISTSPWTTPSHASIFTGQYPTRNGVDGRNILLDPDSTTLASELTRLGFQTAGFTNNVYIRRQTGLARGFQQYEEFWGRNEGSSLMLLIELINQKLRPRIDTGAVETRTAITQWLRHDWTGDHPFFLFIHLMEPHAPYGVPTSDLQKFLPAGITIEEALKVNQDPELYISGQLKMNERDFEILTALYENDIHYVDRMIGQILQDFRDRNLLKNTLVIFTSDHGEHFGDHGLMSHELSLYDVLLRIPLIIRFPDAKQAGVRVTETVETVDIFPSILQLLRSPADHLDLQGHNLAPESIVTRTSKYAFSEYNNSRAADKMERRFPKLPVSPLWRRKVLKSVRSNSWKFIWGSDGTRELYSIDKDRYELTNLVSTSPDEAKMMEEVLAKWSASFEPSRFHRQEEISREALEELRSLGYIHK